MSGGRRLQPNPAVMQPVSELVDPALAQPYMPEVGPGTGEPGRTHVGTPPMVHPAMVRAQQDAQAAAAGIPGFESASEPFAKFHNDEPGQEGEPRTEGEKITPLTDAERAEFADALTIGRRSKMIDVYGHPIFIENLGVGDDLRVGVYCRPFQGAPPADSRSYQIAVVACGLRTIDGKPLYQKLTDDEDDEVGFQIRLKQVEKMYPPVVTQIYRAILDLDKEWAELEAKLVGKSNG